MKVFHVEGKEIVEISSPYVFLDGDVYLIDNSDNDLAKKVFVWLGPKSSADEKAVGAWAAKILDIKDASIDIDTVVGGYEPTEFYEAIGEFNIKAGNTPGFLRHVEINAGDISYAMYRVYDADISDGSSFDDIVNENVVLSKDSLKSDDVFVLDAYHSLFVWIGANSQVGEKVAGNRLARKFDVDRARTPMIYTIREGEEPEGFFDLLDSLTGDKAIRTDDGAALTSELTDVTEVSESHAPPPLMTPTQKPAPPVVASEPAPPVVFEPESPVVSEIPPVVKQTTTQSGLLKLYFISESSEFVTDPSKSKFSAVLELNLDDKKGVLKFTPEAGLIAKRTAMRQANGICKTGYQNPDGSRVGADTKLEIIDDAIIADRLLQVGHDYR